MQTKAIKQKMKSIGNIGKITKTMEMVSVAKMKRAVTRTNESKSYAKKSRDILGLISGHPAVVGHALVKNFPLVSKELVVIIASDKGLCGGYHVQLARTLRDYKATSTHSIEAVCVGKYAEKIANRLSLPIVASFIALPETLDGDMLRPLRNFLLSSFHESGFQKVSVAYTEYVKSLVYTPTVTQLLPLVFTPVEESLDTEDYTFEPNAKEIFDSIAPGLIASIVYQFLLEAKAAEHSSRMVAMKNASDNATSLKDELVISYNRIRQAAITQEITEIISGANAL